MTSFTSEDDGYRLVEHMFGGGIPMKWRGCLQIARWVRFGCGGLQSWFPKSIGEESNS